MCAVIAAKAVSSELKASNVYSRVKYNNSVTNKVYEMK